MLDDFEVLGLVFKKSQGSGLVHNTSIPLEIPYTWYRAYVYGTERHSTGRTRVEWHDIVYPYPTDAQVLGCSSILSLRPNMRAKVDCTNCPDNASLYLLLAQDSVVVAHVA